ncbi:hypothetical protein BSPWISOX_2613 [uncultured Gammaproteobacteria bacterium]|nr:hypothetical protein BSPCLSOX_2708 [uncultured Gammaproteobacteria bacterium]VVH62206.1 hypothetical protein BSPWISOX_2613 [uncultured Gammaproteobacteria bacterium]
MPISLFTIPTQNNNPTTIKFWETEQRRPSEKMVEKLRHL